MYMRYLYIYIVSPVDCDEAITKITLNYYIELMVVLIDNLIVGYVERYRCDIRERCLFKLVSEMYLNYLNNCILNYY